MRIISSTGEFDLPYETSEIVVKQEDEKITVRANSYLMATYSSVDNVIYALDALRTKYAEAIQVDPRALPYTDYPKIFCFPTDEEATKVLQEKAEKNKAETKEKTDDVPKVEGEVVNG